MNDDQGVVFSPDRRLDLLSQTTHRITAQTGRYGIRSS